MHQPKQSGSHNICHQHAKRFCTVVGQVARASIRAFERTDREYIDAVRGAFRLGFGDINHVGSCALSAVLYDNVIIVANGKTVEIGCVSWHSTLNAAATHLSWRLQSRAWHQGG